MNKPEIELNQEPHVSTSSVENSNDSNLGIIKPEIESKDANVTMNKPEIEDHSESQVLTSSVESSNDANVGINKPEIELNQKPQVSTSSAENSNDSNIENIKPEIEKIKLEQVSAPLVKDSKDDIVDMDELEVHQEPVSSTFDDMINNVQLPNQENDTKSDSSSSEENLPKAVAKMRYFVVGIKSEEVAKTLKAKVCVYMQHDAELPAALIDSLIEVEVKDRVAKKALIFCLDEEVVGVGMLLDAHNVQLDRKRMKMFFLSDQRVELSKLQ
jgi:hypothetical protein